jgi:hypothetical protein
MARTCCVHLLLTMGIELLTSGNVGQCIRAMELTIRSKSARSQPLTYVMMFAD